MAGEWRVRALAHGLRWRVKGLGRDVGATSAALQGGDAGRVGRTIVRIGRSPAANGPWYLHQHGEELLCELNTRLPVPVFLAFGTLLGHVRGDGFIRHDDDIDLGVLAEDWSSLEKAIPGLRAAGFRVEAPAPWEYRLTARRHGNVPVDLFRFDTDGADRITRVGTVETNRIYRFPAQLVAPIRPLHPGSDWMGPAEPEAFLAHHYGNDWRTPRTDWDYASDPNSLE